MLGFPLWLIVTHFLNIIFMTLLVRSGLQILADHPKLYWNDDCTPGTEWIKFGKKEIPNDKLWTSHDEVEYINPVLGITGGTHKLGSARRWHFFSVILWLSNGFVYVTMLFVTGEWRRLVPTSFDIFPKAFYTFTQYLTFHFPNPAEFTPYDPLQQLTYFAVIFIFAPLMIVTGLALAPAITARFPWYQKLFGGRQAARSIHFLGLVGISLFVVIHLVMVALVNGPKNISNITLGDSNGDLSLAITIFAIGIAIFVFSQFFVTWYTLRYEKRVQDILDPVINFFTNSLLDRIPSKQHYSKKDISSYFRVNGLPPENEEWKLFAEHNFRDWKLKIGGLVKNKAEFSLEDLKNNFTKNEQITKHNCIQGWSAVAEWAGVSMQDILEYVEPLPNAQYIVFTAYDEDEKGRPYYETFTLKEMMMPQSLLAYEMNYETLPSVYGAPLRLRAESKLGFKMVKYLRSIDIVENLSGVGEGRRGYKEGVELFDEVAAI
ncbi:MAG: molybdopterin-dependent oxidoreductase [Candidatus Paceibacterota bacterium]